MIKKIFNINNLIILLICLDIGVELLALRLINLHSVHPIFGNYKKFDSNCHKCQPWDACK